MPDIDRFRDLVAAVTAGKADLPATREEILELSARAQLGYANAIAALLHLREILETNAAANVAIVAFNAVQPSGADPIIAPGNSLLLGALPLRGVIEDLKRLVETLSLFQNPSRKGN